MHRFDSAMEASMTRNQTNEYRERLRALAIRLGGTVAGLEEGVRTPTGGQAAGGLSNAPLHLGDVGTDAFNQELDATLLENETFIRDEVAGALDRINRGTFGRCENCGRQIVLERLDALPYTRYCTRCASELHSGRAVNVNDGRPDTWLGSPGHEGRAQTNAPQRVVGRDLGGRTSDKHAAGTPGGGSASGGLAGSNIGRGSPREAILENAMGGGRPGADADSSDEDEDAPEAFSGRAGGAVGGTPANKRAKGGQSSSPKRTPNQRPSKSKKRKSR
jgi:RNA polymerase-binding transcription factor DksA